MELPGERKIGKPQKRFMDVVKGDMQWVGMTEEHAGYRVRWRQIIQ